MGMKSVATADLSIVPIDARAPTPCPEDTGLALGPSLESAATCPKSLPRAAGKLLVGHEE